MNATLAKKLRFSDVVYAINTTPKSLRLWLQRGLVRIHTPKPDDGGWTEYSFIDIALLALTRTYANFGMSVPEASSIAFATLSETPEIVNTKNPSRVPASALAVLWTNNRIQIFREGEEWCWRRIALYETHLSPEDRERIDPHLPSGVAALRWAIEPAAAFLTVDVEQVLRTAFERADESVTEGAEEGLAD